MKAIETLVKGVDKAGVPVDITVEYKAVNMD